jgi:hypothetical protein
MAHDDNRTAPWPAEDGFAIMTASSALAQKVIDDWDSAVDFSKYKAYACGKAAPAKNHVNDERIIRAIEGQLALKVCKRSSPRPISISWWLTPQPSTRSLIRYHELWSRLPLW